MQIDLYPGTGVRLDHAARTAREAEASGFDSLWVLEAPYEPFGPLAVASEATESLGLRTAVAVAFARNPMIMAQHAHELARASGGRFILGIGTQVEAHITRRFGERWSRPAARMSEYIAALRAIWRCWNDRVPLDFRGQFYQHTLMTPMFDPGPSGVESPAIHVAAVGPRMVEIAALHADGLVMHPLSSPRVLAERMLPSIPTREDGTRIELSCPVLVATGTTEEEQARAEAAVRKQLAFYASTPAYRDVLDLYGEGDRADELRRQARAGAWDEMTSLITEELLAEFAIVARPGEVRSRLRARYGDQLNRAAIYAPYEVGSELLASLGSG